MTQQVINIGTIPGDHTGTKGLRTAGDMINDNFGELYAAVDALSGFDLEGLSDAVDVLTATVAPFTTGADVAVDRAVRCGLATVTVASGDVAKSIALTAANVTRVLLGNTNPVELTLTGPVAGACYSLALYASGGARSFTWGTSVTWVGDEPDGTLAPGNAQIVTLLAMSGGILLGWASAEGAYGAI